MLRIIRRIAVVVVVIVVLAVVGGFAAIQLRWKRTFDAPYPSITASSDPTVVERGRYLVYGPAACAYCHVPRDQWSRLQQGTELPLTGGHMFPLPFGDLYSANITPDRETGIGVEATVSWRASFVTACGRTAVPRCR